MTIVPHTHTLADHRSLKSRTVAFHRGLFSHAGQFVTALALGALLHFSTLDARAAVITSGSVSDPAGDAIGGIADITSGSVSVDDAGTITLTAHFASGTFTPSDDFIVFGLDLDSNCATSPGSMFLPGLGIEAYFNIPAGSNPGSGAVLLWNGAGYTVTFTTFPSTPIADGVTATLPLSLFGTATPTMNFGVYAGTIVPQGEGTDALFRDWTSIGSVGRLAAGVPDGGSSALLFSTVMLSLLSGTRLLRRGGMQLKGES
jgi:hypothetical protein